MALHRDIYWVGRQWALTGFGIQAIDQRLQGAFDIEFSQVWDESLQARIRAHAWVNAEDFDKALLMARQRVPEAGRKSLPLVESVLELIQQPASGPAQQAALRDDEVGLEIAETAASLERPQTAPSPPFQLRMQGRLARFVPQWRVKR